VKPLENGLQRSDEWMKPPPQENPASKVESPLRRCRYIELENTQYRKAWDLQQDIVAARNDGRLDTDMLLLLEHPRVFTMGRRGGLDNLTVPEAFLQQKGIEVVQIERGGDITYHGPGQLVGYPMIQLSSHKLSVVDFVGKLEEIMIRTAAQFGVKAQTDQRNRGAWIGNCKLGSIGIAVRRGVTFHGFALNVNTDLSPFGWVNPCGLEGVGVTSLANEIGEPLPMPDVRSAACKFFEETLNFRLEPVTMNQLQKIMWIHATSKKEDR
jgi:lipoate-protein ligase B